MACWFADLALATLLLLLLDLPLLLGSGSTRSTKRIGCDVVRIGTRMTFVARAPIKEREALLLLLLFLLFRRVLLLPTQRRC